MGFSEYVRITASQMDGPCPSSGRERWAQTGWGPSGGKSGDAEVQGPLATNRDRPVTGWELLPVAEWEHTSDQLCFVFAGRGWLGGSTVLSPTEVCAHERPGLCTVIRHLGDRLL